MQCAATLISNPQLEIISLQAQFLVVAENLGAMAFYRRMPWLFYPSNRVLQMGDFALLCSAIHSRVKRVPVHILAYVAKILVLVSGAILPAPAITVSTRTLLD